MDETKLKEIEKLFAYMANSKASDLHIKYGHKPILRIATVISEVGNKVLSADEVKRLIYAIMTESQIAQLEKDGDIDFAHNVDGVGRFRINVFKERSAVAVAVRRVNIVIPTCDELNLPSSVIKVSDMDRGLILVAGPTGSGKSTTIACILDAINKNNKVHIITVEDPIEFMFQSKKAFISQREIGIDVDSFGSALKHIVRQDPDVILIGEMRDCESLDAALTAAETGHLVLGSIHSSSAAQTISRILDLFPAGRQPIVRQSLSFNLRVVICQKLVPACKEGISVVPAVEMMFVNPTIQKLIQNGEDNKIHDVIRGSAEEGMQDFNQSLIKLINEKLITKKEAMIGSPNPEQLKMNLQGISLQEDRRIIG